MKLDLEELDSMLHGAWSRVVDFYVGHFVEIKATGSAEMFALKQRFEERFGDAVSQQVAALATSYALNGNKQAGEDPEGFFPGLEYSLPASLYFMRKALDEEHGEYKHFVKDVEKMFENQGKEPGPIPSKKFMKALVKPYLDDLLADQQDRVDPNDRAGGGTPDNDVPEV